jgi:hypothetical protein
VVAEGGLRRTRQQEQKASLALHRRLIAIPSVEPIQIACEKVELTGHVDSAYVTEYRSQLNLGVFQSGLEPTASIEHARQSRTLTGELLKDLRPTHQIPMQIQHWPVCITQIGVPFCG